MVKSSKQGTAIEIATGGIVTPDGLGIATQGLVEPKNIYSPEIGGGVTVGGDASATVIVNYRGGGDIVSGGTADVVLRRSGGVVGGGVTIGGSAGIIDIIKFGRGGANLPKRKRLPTKQFTPSEYDPDTHLNPVDYRKKIEDAIAQAEFYRREQQRFISNGTISINGRAKIVFIARNLSDGEIIVAKGAPLTPIELDLPHVFNTGATAREIAELEDHLILNDLFGLGDYKITKGAKARYIHHAKTPTVVTKKPKFGNSAGHRLITQVEKTQRREDDEFMLEVNMRTQQDQEEEELRMLGIID